MKKIMLTLALALLGLAGLCSPPTALALEIVPFDSANQSPLVDIYGLPGSGHFLSLSPGETEVGMNIQLTSNYAADENQREQIILDGETTRFTLTARHAFSLGLELGIKLPYIVQGGGFMDNFIEDYHRTFGFPQGGRDQAPNNRLLYRYRKDGVNRLLMNSSGSGIGDVQLTAAMQLYEDRKMARGISLNCGVKLPTGDSDQLMGSGGTDLSLWLTGGTHLGEAWGKWTVYGSAGMLYMTDSDILPDQQKDWVGFGSLGLGWAPLARLVLKVETDANTAFYNGSDLRELADTAVQLVAGGTIALGQNSSLDIGVAEDLVTTTAPDVVFHLNLRRRF